MGYVPPPEQPAVYILVEKARVLQVFVDCTVILLVLILIVLYCRFATDDRLHLWIYEQDDVQLTGARWVD